jgi:hypothetical protein
MSAVRKLTLKKETLTDLTKDELRDVVGAAMSGVTCPVNACQHSDYNCPPSLRPSCLPTCYCTPPPF